MSRSVMYNIATFYSLPITIGTLVTLMKIGCYIVACMGEVYQPQNSERKPHDKFLTHCDPLLSPDLSIYRALCLILVVAFRRWVSVIITTKKCDAYFSIVSIIVMYRLVRLYLVTTSFVSSETCVSLATFSTYGQENKIEKLWRITDVSGNFLTSFITWYLRQYAIHLIRLSGIVHLFDYPI